MNHTISVKSWVFSPPKEARTCHKVQNPTMQLVIKEIGYILRVLILTSWF